MSLSTISGTRIRLKNVISSFYNNNAAENNKMCIPILTNGILFGEIEIKEENNQVILTNPLINDGNGNEIPIYSTSGGWLNEGFRDLYILNFHGSEATNPDILNWFENNTESIENDDLTRRYVTLSSPNSFTLATSDGTKHWNGLYFSYSTDLTDWTVWDGTTTLTSSQNGNLYYLYLRNNGNIGQASSTSITGSKPFILTGSNISISGYISSLLFFGANGNTSQVNMNYSIPTSNCFKNLFYIDDNTPNTSIVDCSGLICDISGLSSTGFYESAFRNCTSLVNSPQLPIKYFIQQGIYSRMFQDCTSLINTPDLLAKNISASCYGAMFSGCTSLIKASDLPAEDLKSNSYTQMFLGCTSLKIPPKIYATTLGATCCNRMFSGCTSLKKLPDLHSLLLNVKTVYKEMFLECSNIKLSETQTRNYIKEFRIPKTGTGTLSISSGLTDMFKTTGGTFTGTPSINTSYYLYIEPSVFDLDNLNLPAGTYTITVKAKDSNFANSVASNSISFTSTGVQGTQHNLKIFGYDGRETSYDIYVDGVFAATVIIS